MTKRPNLLALVAAIEGNPSAAPRAHETVEPATKPVALPERAWLDDSNALAEARAAVTSYRQGLSAMAQERDEAMARLRDGQESFQRMVQRIADLTRELAEARADRAAEDRTAERVQVVTDASAWHFLTPQGEGTADRIKAIGGRWVFHRRTERARFYAAGYWLVPHSPDAGELLAAFRFESKRMDVRPL